MIPEASRKLYENGSKVSVIRPETKWSYHEQVKGLNGRAAVVIDKTGL